MKWDKDWYVKDVGGMLDAQKSFILKHIKEINNDPMFKPFMVTSKVINYKQRQNRIIRDNEYGEYELSIVSDQIGSPTFATDLAKAILGIIVSKDFIKENQTTKIYHYSNEGDCSWYELAKEIFKLANIKCKTNPITTQQYQTPAKRPKNTVMSKDKVKKVFCLDIPIWEESIRTCINEISLRRQNI